MPEYIKRMSAMTICERYIQHCFETDDNRGQDIADRIFDEITEIPTADVVEVVRCKDCKYYEKWSDRSIFCNKHIVFMGMNDNDYCSYGELKEQQND